MVKLQSILDNDFYKFTMQQCVVKLFPRAKAKYQFINRGQHRFPAGFAAALRQSVAEMANLKLSASEKLWLAKTCPYLDPVYLDFLNGYHYDPTEVTIVEQDDHVEVQVEGLWYRTILWEVPLLALISENYYLLNNSPRATNEEAFTTAELKMQAYKQLGVTIADFGTRRRHSFQVHDVVIAALKQFGRPFVGTSNVHLAMKHNTRPIGTHAHEWFMFHAAKYGYKMANSLALEHWVDVYRGELGIALTDTFTTRKFFEIFDKKFARLFDGLRHDSGDPLSFATIAIEHYKRMGIDPLSKTIVFSDALNFEKVKQIAAFCHNKIGFSFGIGTNLTNDVGLQPLNIVIKMIAAKTETGNWTDVVKLSDEPHKHTGTEAAISLSKAVLEID